MGIPPPVKQPDHHHHRQQRNHLHPESGQDHCQTSTLVDLHGPVQLHHRPQTWCRKQGRRCHLSQRHFWHHHHRQPTLDRPIAPTLCQDRTPPLDECQEWPYLQR